MNRLWPLLALLFCLAASVFAAEQMQSEILEPSRQPNSSGLTPGTFGFQAVDQSGTYSNYQVIVCIDDTTEACTAGYRIVLFTNCSNATCSAKNSTFLPPAGTNNGITPRDGLPHTLYAWQVSQGGQADMPVDFSPKRFQWDLANNNLLADDTANVTRATPMTAAQMAVGVDALQKVSTGSSAGGGNLLCTISGVGIYDNGGAGYLVNAFGIPCDSNHIFVVSLGASDNITFSTFSGTIGAAINALPPGIEGLTLAWMNPSLVVSGLGGNGLIQPGPGGRGGTSPGYGITGLASMWLIIGGVEPAQTSCIERSYVGGGFVKTHSYNPWFNSGDDALPRTNYNFLPTTLLMPGICPGCTSTVNFKTWTADFATTKSMIDAAKAAIGSNPIGGYSLVAFTNNSGRQNEAVAVAPSSIGTVLSRRINFQLQGSYASPIGQDMASSAITNNVVLYEQGSDKFNWLSASPLNFIPGSGMWMNYTSFSGALGIVNGNGQTPINTALGASSGLGATPGIPAVAAMALAVEPCESVYFKSPRPNLFTAYYGAGFDVLQAAYKSLEYPWNINMISVPFAQPYSPSFLRPFRRPAQRQP